MILVLNAGSSSIKFAIIENGEKRRAGAVTEIGGAAAIEMDGMRRDVSAPDHDAALSALLDVIADAGISRAAFTAVAYRVVHGGTRFIAPTRLTAEVISALHALSPLAPLHNPPALCAIEALMLRVPELPHVAVFDTAFHASIPACHHRYALPDLPAASDIRRYGFHGISYAGIVHRLAAEGALPNRLLALHLGNGASASAILNGQSHATTMGYSPLEGLTMGTRSGDIDGNAVLEIARRLGIEGAAHLLNRQSGLIGLGGHSDMRALLAAHTPEADFARTHFIAKLIQSSGAMIAAMGGLDTVVFTGGIGEHDAALREEFARGMAFLGLKIDATRNSQHAAIIHANDSPIEMRVVKAEEELTIARLAAALI